MQQIPECQKYLAEGPHRRIYTFSPDENEEIAGVWGNGEQALPGDPRGASCRWWTACRRRQDPPGQRRRLRLHAGLRAGGDVRDRHEAPSGLSAGGEGEGANPSPPAWTRSILPDRAEPPHVADGCRAARRPAGGARPFGLLFGLPRAVGAGFAGDAAGFFFTVSGCRSRSRSLAPWSRAAWLLGKAA